MLDFFRKYQRFFFLIITVVIVISFSFFGTYSSLTNDNYHDQVALNTVNGSSVTRGELERMAMFIGTDSDDKLLFGGIWGPNFLNDGVIRKDFLATGLAEQLVEQYPNDVATDLEKRLAKEKRYTTYTHPQAAFISVVGAWNYLAPHIKTNFDTLRSQTNPLAPEAFQARVHLYLGERDLPAPALQQVLRYQQRQYSWVQGDPNLERTDLSLFGYHTLDDWFGPRFVRLVSAFIINSAQIAEQRGYKVSKEEALADLMHNAEISYRDNASNPNLGVTNSSEYFNEQLHRLSLDQNKAAQIWRQVLLFRRLFHDVGQAMFVDPQSLQPFESYAQASLQGDLYRLPLEFRFSDFRTLQEFEAYLKAISPQQEQLSLPTKFFSVAEVSLKTPELVQKRYLLNVAQVNKAILQARVSVKDSWNWEVEEKNWAALQEHFPELSAKKGATRDERYAALDALDERTRTRVDTFAREALVDQHPDWLDQALQNAEPQQMTVGLHLKGGHSPFPGLQDNKKLMELLDKATIGELYPALAQFTGDGKTYSRIIVIDRSSSPEILTFAETQQDNLIEELLNRETKNDLSPLLKSIYEDYAKSVKPEKAPPQLIDDVSASLRFYPYMRTALAELKKDPKSTDKLVHAPLATHEVNTLPARAPLANQWKLVEEAYTAERSDENNLLQLQEFFSLEPGAWSKVHTPVNGDLFFFQLKSKGGPAAIATLSSKVNQTQTILSDEAQQQLMKQLLMEMKAKKAISLDFMNPKEDNSEQS